MSEQPRFMLIASSKMESDPAFHRAAALAKAQGAALHIVAFDYLEGLVGSTVENLLYRAPCSIWVVAPEFG